MNIILSSHELLELIVERTIERDGYKINSGGSMLAVLSMLSEKLGKL